MIEIEFIDQFATYAFGTALSGVRPKGIIRVPPPVWLTNQVALDGLNTPASHFPSLS